MKEYILKELTGIVKAVKEGWDGETKNYWYQKLWFLWKDEHCYDKCLGCGKDVCYECKKAEGNEFYHSVHCGGSGDGFYCIICLGNPKIIKTSLYQAYLTIQRLRNEEKVWYDDFRIRCENAEKDLKKIQ